MIAASLQIATGTGAVPTLLGIRVEFLLFAATLIGVAVLHERAMVVALSGMAAILAFKLAQVDLLTALDGRPPLLLLDDVFSELDPDRRAHLVRRIAELPQALVPLC